MKNKTISIFLRILIFVAPITIILGFLHTLTLPFYYVGSRVVKVVLPMNPTQQYTEDALLALTQQKAVLIKTKTILDAVIEEHQLDEKWRKGGSPLPRNITRKILANSIQSTTYKQTIGLIQITVQRDEHNEAYELAKSVAMAYDRTNDDITMVDILERNVLPVSPATFINIFGLFLSSIPLCVVFAVSIARKRNAKATGANTEFNDMRNQ